MTSKIEQATLKLPPTFDKDKHAKLLDKWVVKELGEGWAVDHANIKDGTVTATRQTEITEIEHGTGTQSDTKEVNLARGTKPADGDRTATKLEDQYPGYRLTKFEPYLGWARLTKMSDDTVRARGAIAQVLGVKPWEVQVTDRAGGGFHIELPSSKYSSAKHDDKLQATVETDIGRDGWYIKTNPQKLTAEIIPSDPPTFPGMIPYPFERKVPRLVPADGQWAKIPFGQKLGVGQESGDDLDVDLAAAAHGSIAGISNGGKTVAVNGFIYGLLARGFELALIDVKHKSTDFLWAKDLCRPGGWGCESIKASVATMSLAIEEAERRAKIIAEHGVQKWTELPAELGIRPIAIILDEVTALFLLEEVPKGLPKDHSLVTEAIQANLEKQILKKLVGRVAAEWRFAGLHIFICTQMAQNNTGIPPTIKINMGNKFLFGSNPNDASRGHAFSDARAVPKVPVNIQNDSKANRGVGAAELEGQQAPCVFKAFFATTDDYRQHLLRRGVPQTDRPEPTPTEIAKYIPSLDEGYDDSPRPKSRLETEGGFGHDPMRDEPRLRGAAAAAHALKLAEAAG
ncbi:FtsK/SpoIIIE domain-containing protein [Agromyces sp. NPDC057679]|uniref:FtsK/SpoIIIE domain-containing protein n=1 Tax=Agromyces sp. NPDC057679 TaxID=3346207 RepID=UPI00366AC00A